VAEEALKPGEWQAIYSWIEKLLGHQLPTYVQVPLGLLVLAALVASVALIIVAAVSKMQELVLEKIWPKLYNSEKKHKAWGRQLFAKHLSREIETINAKENWRDAEFAELEAEVEAEGSRQSLLPWGTRRGVRRERSLSTALKASTERLILLEGDPGSGKSVALRHVALEFAQRAARSLRTDSVLPVFVNLKSLQPGPDRRIDRDLIRSYALKSMNRINDRFVDEFLDANFDEGVQSGKWIFFFDSFDEIPEVLSSIESDEVVSAYSSAISDFLSGLNSCRGVIASRFYKGPATQGWRKFRILDLTPDRQRDLVRKAFVIAQKLSQQLLADLLDASEDVQVMARNPLMLGLLCEHVRLGNTFPRTNFEVFSKYISYRLEKDADRVSDRYSVGPSDCKTIGEEIAYSMSADQQIGLAPTRSELYSALRRQGFRRPKAQLYQAIDALEYMRLARQEASGPGSDDPQFSFAHRRFQEFFATSIVLNDPTRLTPSTLLHDARWRETAVVICQTAAPDAMHPIFREISDNFDNLGLATEVAASDALATRGGVFRWPAGSLHILGILQDGFSARAAEIPAHIREASAALIRRVFAEGDLLEKKLALMVAGIIPDSELVSLIREALAIRSSQILDDISFRQVGRLAAPPDDIRRALRLGMLRTFLSGGFAGRWSSMEAYVRRIPNDPGLIEAARLTRWSKPLGLALATIPVLPLLWLTPAALGFVATSVAVQAASYSLRYSPNAMFLVLARGLMFEVFLGLSIALAGLQHKSVLGLVPHNPHPVVAGSAVLMYGLCLMWPESSLSAIEDNLSLALWQWPLLPILHLLKMAKQVLVSMSTKYGLIVFLLSILSVSLIIWLQSAIGPIVTYILVALSAIPCLLMVAVSAQVTVLFLIDFRLARRCMKKHLHSVTGVDLEGAFRSLTTEWWRARLLTKIRSSGTLQKDGAEQPIRNIICEVEKKLSTKESHATGSINAAPSTSIRKQLTWEAIALRFGTKFNWSRQRQYLFSQRDEAYLLLEANTRRGSV
jgi:NACHT domain